MEELGVPGVALGVVAGGEEETACLGVTSLENPLEVTPDTLFQIGSITKTYVAAAVMRLVERGDLDLDAPVRGYLPEMRLQDAQAAAHVTLRHLLTHTGGWVGDVFEDFGRGDDAVARAVQHLADVRQLTPLGEVWSYNNAGFYIVGRVIEVIAGSVFESAMDELVLEPLGLDATFFYPDEVMTHRFAVGHVRDEEEQAIVAREWSIGRWAHPAGGIVQSLRDLLRYGRFAFDGRPLLRRQSFAELRSAQVQVGGNIDAVGLAWMLRRIDGVDLISHGGGTKGQVSELVVAPHERFVFAVLTNHEYGGVLIERLFNPVLEAYLGVREPEPEPRELDAERLSEYAGRYASWMSDAELVVAGAGLEARLIPKRGFPTPESKPAVAPPPAQLVFYDDDWVFATDDLWKGTRAGFLRDSSGRIVWLRLGGRVYARA